MTALVVVGAVTLAGVAAVLYFHRLALADEQATRGRP